jgi:Na+-transporting methylmalonyl-CoA/oxaloacetate decarboxylase gamma subunit
VKVGRTVIAGDRDSGSAVVEFVSIGVLLLVPLVYLVICLSRIQAASFAADGSAREAARAFVTAQNQDDGYRRAAIAVRLALHDQGFDDSRDGSLSITCSTSTCLTPGGRVQAEVRVRVVLPGLPHFVDRALSTSVTVRAEHTAVVDEFRARQSTP